MRVKKDALLFPVNTHRCVCVILLHEQIETSAAVTPAARFSCCFGLSLQTNFITCRGQGHVLQPRTDPPTLQRAFLISVIPAEDYNTNPWDASLLITETISCCSRPAPTPELFMFCLQQATGA